MRWEEWSRKKIEISNWSAWLNVQCEPMIQWDVNMIILHNFQQQCDAYIVPYHSTFPCPFVLLPLMLLATLPFPTTHNTFHCCLLYYCKRCNTWSYINPSTHSRWWWLSSVSYILFYIPHSMITRWPPSYLGNQCRTAECSQSVCKNGSELPVGCHRIHHPTLSSALSSYTAPTKLNTSLRNNSFQWCITTAFGTQKPQIQVFPVVTLHLQYFLVKSFLLVF